MRDFNKVGLNASRPNEYALNLIDFCLEQLYKDKKHVVTDEIVEDLTFEELIGALIRAKDELED